VSAAREQGINSVSVDVIYGPPLQTCESFARPLDQVNGLSPDRISLYSYAHLPNRFKTQKQINVVELPTVGLLPVTPKGRFFIRNVCMVFDAYLPVLTPAFSKAI
jgi:coproporphyrinogen III oxidase-like Fe-S oxidoreductase